MNEDFTISEVLIFFVRIFYLLTQPLILPFDKGRTLICC